MCLLQGLAFARLKESVSTGSYGKKACTHCDDRGWARGDPFCGQILTDVETTDSCLTIAVSTLVLGGFWKNIRYAIIVAFSSSQMSQNQLGLDMATYNERYNRNYF